MSHPVALADFETAARAQLPPMAYDYIAGGAGDECTLRWNEAAWNELRLRHRVLVDVSHLDTSTTLLGRPRAHPILLAPTAYQRLICDAGELDTARARATPTRR